MQSAIVLAVMVLVSLFMGAEYARNGSTTSGIYQPFKAENVAANILQYHALFLQYILANFDKLHLMQSINPGTAEQINQLEYQSVSMYSLKNLMEFLNYSTVVFNYTNVTLGESQPLPVLYVATSWASYSNDVHGYSNVSLTEVMGQLGQDISKHVYQGNSTFWVVPWVFSQYNCNIIEIYSQLPNDATGATTFGRLQALFNLICTQIEANSSYKFLSYVYIEPVFNAPNI